MSKSKSSYPERPVSTRGKQKGSEHIHGRRKTWLSERTAVTGTGLDVSPRLNRPWWKSPLMKAERLAKAASRKS